MDSDIQYRLNDFIFQLRESLSGNKFLLIFLGIMIVVIIGVIIIYIQLKRNEPTRSSNNNKYMFESYPTKIGGFGYTDAKYQHALRDYYIMSAYNCCCIGNYENSFVEYDAMKYALKRGARLLDFEIYSIQDMPVVAASASETNFYKGTYNSLPFTETMKQADRYAFAGGISPNSTDPLLIHLRIKSSNTKIYPKIASALTQAFHNRLLGAQYSYESNGENFTKTPVKDLMGKVIIIINKGANHSFKGTPLDEYINITSGNVFMRSLREHDVKYTPNFQELTEHNKKNMTISMPDLSSKLTNPSMSLDKKYGIQCTCMNFQYMDENLEYYIDYFNKYNSAFVLKPIELRFVPKTIDAPQKQDKSLSYARRVVEKPYFRQEI
jgi:hypothetical protein